MEHLQAIRERRERAVQRALATLDLYAASDTQAKPALLRMAGTAFTDGRIAARWIGLLANESDQTVRTMLLAVPAKFDFRQVPDSAACITQLLDCLQEPDAREWALFCLHRLAPQNPQIVAPLIESYRTLRDDKVKRRIIAMLLQVAELSDALIAFFVSLLDELDADSKTVLVKRLLERDALTPEQLAKLLVVTEPSTIKVLVLDHCADRAIRLDGPATLLLRKDPDPACRYAAVWALTETGAPPADAFAALLEAAEHDTDDRVRELALNAFEFVLAKTPDVIRMLLSGLNHETSVARAKLILKLLAPHLNRSPEIVPALRNLLDANLKTTVALEIYRLLGTLAPWNTDVRKFLIARCVSEKEDRIKAVILEALARLNSNEPELLKLYADALRLPEPAIQQWGVQGMLLLPATAEFLPLLVQSADVLLTHEIPLSLRLALAQKLATLPEKPAELREKLNAVGSKTRDTELRRICEEVANSASADATDAAEVRIDWDAWIHRAEVEHRGDGIFPALYEHFDEAPTQARRVLKALLNPQCADNLYGKYGYDVNEGTILTYLDAKDAVDDDVSRFCIGRTLTQTAGTPDHYLQTLLANPNYPDLKNAFWQILEKRPDAGAALLRTLLVTAYADEDAAVAELSARIEKCAARALKPYLRLLLENLGWHPVRALLLKLARRTDITGEAREQLDAALKKLKPTYAPDPDPARRGDPSPPEKPDHRAGVRR